MQGLPASSEPLKCGTRFLPRVLQREITFSCIGDFMIVQTDGGAMKGSRGPVARQCVFIHASEALDLLFSRGGVRTRRKVPVRG